MARSFRKLQMCFLIGSLAPLSWTFAEATNEELQARIKQLEERLERGEAKEATQPTKAEGDATVQRVLQDAERRSRIIDTSSIDAGWEPQKQQFFIASHDRDFY